MLAGLPLELLLQNLLRTMSLGMHSKQEVGMKAVETGLAHFQFVSLTTYVRAQTLMNSRRNLHVAVLQGAWPGQGQAHSLR